jgi:hypothetical protein
MNSGTQRQPISQLSKSETAPLTEPNLDMGKPIAIETPTQWIRSCVLQMNNRYLSFNGIGANDVCFIPSGDIFEDIFYKCISIVPPPEKDLQLYKNWLRAHIDELLSIKPGSPRSVVDRLLIQNGGLYGPDKAIYSLKDCEYLKVRIQFNENNQVLAISKPYLGLFISD